ncbi:flagellar hook-length control protein FliK [Saccharibacillus qingshengii]|uniref:flagellar hook-length control protein FliK n=1 Tax=Saccharibacillus qingshengii TaxID=1763540 RepID=UPI001552605D|nr:flagellar hook-length control protein FliK [Saccharibacillus qingshengii]
MNIGSLFKSMIGDAKPGEVKQLDLREGQVVRGVVQSVSEDGKEAVIQIQGVKVNAKLETPLQAGQTAFMQVQPAAEDGSVVMKPVSAPPGAAAGAQSMEDTLKQLALPDNKQNRELVRMMQQAEIPLTREQAADVRNLLAQKPAAVDAQQWVRSIGILQQRGLPVTPQSIAGMQQAVFGPPASAVLQNLEQQVAAVLAQLGDSAGEESALPGRNAGGQAGTAGLTGPAGSAPGAAAAGGQTSAAPTPGAAAAASGSASPAAPPAASGAGMTAAAGQLGSEESGPAAQARSAAQAPAGAGTGTGEAGGPKAAAGAFGPPTAADSAASAAGKAGAAQAPAAAAPQAAPAFAADSRAAQGTAAANGTASASPDAVLLRKVQALLGELHSAAAGSTAAAGQPSAAAAQAAPQQAPPDGAENAPWVGRLLKMLGAEHEQQAARSTLINTAPPAPAAAQPAAAQSAPAAASPQPEPRAAVQPPVPSAPVPTANAAAVPPAAANTDTPPGISAAVRAAADQVLRGVQGENTRLGSELPSAGTAQPAGAAPAAAEVRETLKSLLLQLSASDTLPAAVKDAAQQAVQQLTGQQLLLNTDRTAPFAQVTMFLPFVGPDGNQTASVQIESRRGAKGELDASNCRLWFDLDMKALGHTVVDVQVVDRKVSLNFRNDEEWVRPLLEAGQPQIASALESAGYQLMALRTDTLPQRAEGAAGESGTPLSFVPSSYRGVDVKI